MNRLGFEPMVTPTLWITLAVLAGAMLAWHARTRPTAVPVRRWMAIIGLMGLAAAGLFLILLNPIWTELMPLPAGKPVLTVLIDDSASMAVQDVVGDQSRFAAAGVVGAQIARELGPRYDVRLRTFAETTVPVTPEELPKQIADKPVSDFAAALIESLAVDHPQGHAILMLSDGIDNGAGGIQGLRDALRSAKAMNVPVHTMTFGSETVLSDLEIIAARPQELTFIRQRAPLAVTVRQRGRLTDRAELILLRNDEEIDRREVAVTPDGEASARFEAYETAGGLYRYEVRVSPREGEATHANNGATILLRVTEKPVRALLLEGKPYWDGKFLIRTLATDPALDLDAIVRVSDSRFVKRSLRLPKRNATEQQEPASWQRSESMEVIDEPMSYLEGPEGLSACQVVILGRDADVFLNERVVGRLRTWLSKEGGSLVCFRGLPVSRASDQFSRLLPVRWSPARETRFRPRLTERGLETDWLSAGASAGEAELERLPSLSTVAAQERPKPLSVILATAGESGGPSVMAYQPYGTGRVVALEGSGMWRWAFLAPQYQAHDQVYGALWQSLLRWLVSAVGLIPGQDAALRTDKVNYLRGEPVTAFLLVREDRQLTDRLQVELLRESETAGEKFSPAPIGDEPGAYRIGLGLLPEGNYRLRLMDDADRTAGDLASTAFDVRPYFREQLDVQARPDLMAYIARETGGTALNQEDSTTSLVQEFEAHLSRNRPTRVRRLTAWDRWWVLTGIVAMWGAAWGLRRSCGLI